MSLKARLLKLERSRRYVAPAAAPAPSRWESPEAREDYRRLLQLALEDAPLPEDASPIIVELWPYKDAFRTYFLHSCLEPRRSDHGE